MTLRRRDHVREGDRLHPPVPGGLLHAAGVGQGCGRPAVPGGGRPGDRGHRDRPQPGRAGLGYEVCLSIDYLDFAPARKDQ
jgi:hypothetical protein